MIESLPIWIHFLLLPEAVKLGGTAPAFLLVKGVELQLLRDPKESQLWLMTVQCRRTFADRISSPFHCPLIGNVVHA